MCSKGVIAATSASQITKLTQSGEDYIEAIVMLSGIDEEPVRSVDLALKLGVSKPSVNKAVAALRDLGLVEQEPYGGIHLTDAGKEYGHAMLERHVTLTTFFKDVLQVDPEKAEEEACMIEHVISQDTFDKWAAFIKKQVQ